MKRRTHKEGISEPLSSLKPRQKYKGLEWKDILFAGLDVCLFVYLGECVCVCVCVCVCICVCAACAFVCI